MRNLSAALLIVLLAACGGDSPTVPPAPEPARPTTVTVSPATVELTAVGDTIRLKAEVLDRNGQPMAAAAVTWANNDTSVVTVDQSGLVTASGNGTATITATSGAASGSAAVTVVDPVDRDRAALVALYHVTNGPSWVNDDSWLTDAPLGDWHGVTTDASGQVVWIDLSGTYDGEKREWVRYGLAGPIPPELGNLANLTELWLYGNSLSGPIPPEFGNLANLTELWLYGNSLSGPIPPELGNLANLTLLEVQNNTGMLGALPTSLTNLRDLRRLFADGTALCAPRDSVFQAWLQMIPEQRIAICSG